VPVYLSSVSGVVAVAAGGANDAVVLANGTVMAWGENSAGQLGDGTRVEKPVPTLVRGLTNVKAIAVGGDSSHGSHLLALLNDGTVMALGANGSGQLGDGTTETRGTPVHVRGLSGVVAVSASPSHNIALLSDGTMRVWGNNAFGELGVGSGPETCSGFIGRWSCSRVPVPVPTLSNVTAISAGWRFSLAVSGVRMFSWGWNEMGRLGTGTTLSSSVPSQVGTGSVAAISAGEQHSEALLSGGAPPPEIEMSSGVGTLTVTWRSTSLIERWYVGRRPLTHPHSEWREWLQLPASTRSYTLSGLTSGQPYEVIVKNAVFGVRIIAGTPR
jgi:alpha-tubulin suppressor-like RCC1 family protein